ncbi:MAG: GreA/GreB family elongation factor [Dehalococcoidia bacterium]|nr:GreA/GreB family elongation factor [Dehalococcoidia bacterium]
MEDNGYRGSKLDETVGADLRVTVGSRVSLCDLATGEEMHYTIVHPREADPLRGKISNGSPVGKAVINRSEGDEIEVKVPAGRLRYRVKGIARQS